MAPNKEKETGTTSRPRVQEVIPCRGGLARPHREAPGESRGNKAFLQQVDQQHGGQGVSAPGSSKAASSMGLSLPGSWMLTHDPGLGFEEGYSLPTPTLKTPTPPRAVHSPTVRAGVG